MLLIPELRTVVITPPRTAATAVRKAVRETYPGTINPYRHMEVTGIPYGYDRWTRICIIRHPFHRMWSLYKYMQGGGKSTLTPPGVHKRPERAARLMADTQRPFEDWLLRTGETFADAGEEWGAGFNAFYSTHSQQPEQMKSQAVYAQPHMGTEIIRVEDPEAVMGRLGLKVFPVLNETRHEAPPPISEAAKRILSQRWAWDLTNY